MTDDAVDRVAGERVAVDRAAAVLDGGGLVAFPTETVYGLGADAADPVAVERIFAVKGRPRGHPLIVHIGGVDDLDRWASAVPDAARRLAEAFWPGPLTLVLPRGPRISEVATGGRPDVGLRVPAHPVALELLAAFAARRGGVAAIAAPSANRFGRVSPTTAAHVRADLGHDVEVILDGGPSAVGVESTIVDLSRARPEVLRLGAVDVDQLAGVLGGRPDLAPELRGGGGGLGGGARAPGMLAAHYAPDARLEVVDDPDRAVRRASELAGSGLRVAVLAPGALDGLAVEVLELEPAGPAADFAHVLYDRLRQVDRLGAEVVVVVPPPPGGLGDAVRDRLGRAATGSAAR